MMMIRALMGIVLISFVMAEHNLIVDTDAGFDVDDAAAIAVANKLRYEPDEIIAISHTNAFTKEYAVSVVMEWYNRLTFPWVRTKENGQEIHAGTGNADKYALIWSITIRVESIRAIKSKRRFVCTEKHLSRLPTVPYRSHRLESQRTCEILSSGA